MDLSFVCAYLNSIINYSYFAVFLKISLFNNNNNYFNILNIYRSHLMNFKI